MIFSRGDDCLVLPAATDRMGTCMRNALMSAIYRKCLSLSNTSMQAESVGKVREEGGGCSI